MMPDGSWTLVPEGSSPMFSIDVDHGEPGKMVERMVVESTSPTGGREMKVFDMRKLVGALSVESEEVLASLPEDVRNALLGDRLLGVSGEDVPF